MRIGIIEKTGRGVDKIYLGQMTYGRAADAGGWNITNLGGILFARHLSEFRSLQRKMMRVIVYRDNSRIETIKEQMTGRET